jgi:hypothetical protein
MWGCRHDYAFQRHGRDVCRTTSTTLEPPTPQTADWSRVDEPTRRRASGSADILRDTAEAGDASGDHRVRHGASSSMRYEPLRWIATAECLLGERGCFGELRRPNPDRVIGWRAGWRRGNVRCEWPE